MGKWLQYSFLIFLIFLANLCRAQNTGKSKDTVIQLYGIVMSADSLRGLEAVSVIVEDKGRGTITNDEGVFSIVVLKGDRIRFSSIGFKDKVISIPYSLQSNQYSVIQLMVNDTAYLPATIIRQRATRAQFERDFINADVPADELEIARQNTDEAKRRVLLASLPADGREAVSTQLRQQAQRYYYAGQAPPQNIFNPFVWAEFIKAWKRGDFKKKE